MLNGLNAQVVPQGFLVMQIASVQIGTQVWMQDNLNVTQYRNGDAIPLKNDFGPLVTGAYSNYQNIESNSATYGKLYNWYAVMDSRGICPVGWRVPSYSDFVILINFVAGGYSNNTFNLNNTLTAGGYLKESGTGHWASPNTGATNSYDFNGLPSGWKQGAAYAGLGQYADFWTSTVYDATSAYRFTLYYNNAELRRVFSTNDYGFSVRCIKN